MKKVISILIVISIMAGLGLGFAINEGEERVVIGADITQEQINQVYNTFGVERGSVTELTVNNAEERQYLEGLVSTDIIGSRSISCVYIKTLAAGSGLDVSATNTTWCGKDMYTNALVTAGISDAKVIVTAPVAVSGTAALTGIYKAYEDITGRKLDEEAKAIGTEELVITAELAEELGEYDAVFIVNQLKLILEETKNMTDEELREQIRAIAKEYNISITDGQVNQLVTLCRSLEGLSSDELKAKVESVQSALEKFAKAQNTAGKVVESVKNFFKAIGDFFSKLFG